MYVKTLVCTVYVAPAEILALLKHAANGGIALFSASLSMHEQMCKL
jgi:hypothetical protein